MREAIARALPDPRDASERSDEALRLQALVLESMNEGVSVADEAGFIVFTNPAEDRIFGYERGELIGQHVTVLNDYPPEENERVVADVIAHVKEHGEWVGEWHNVRKNGTPFITRARITGISLGGRPFWLCVQEDVTERVRVAAEKSALLERIAFLSAASQQLSSSLDLEQTLSTLARLAVPAVADWCFVEWTQPGGAIELLAVGHADRELEELARESLRRYPVDPNAPGGTGKVIRTGEPEVVPVVPPGLFAAIARDEEHLALLEQANFCSYLIVPLKVQGRTVGSLAFAHAESGRHFSEADLPLMEELALRASMAIDNARLYTASQEANRVKTSFLAAMSHELRTPLNAIAGYVDLIDAGVHGPVTPAQQKALARVKQSQEHLLTLITDVLNFARLEAGQLHYDIRDIAVADLMNGIAAVIGPQAQARQIAFQEPPCDVALVAHADPDRVRQILYNLLGNSLKFTPAGGWIRVTCDADAERVRIRVADNGRGIPTGRLESIFDPFVQLDRPRHDPSQQGVGLGLAISRDLAHGMGGDLVAESVPGEGATFTLLLPRAR